MAGYKVVICIVCFRNVIYVLNLEIRICLWVIIMQTIVWRCLLSLYCLYQSIQLTIIILWGSFTNIFSNVVSDAPYVWSKQFQTTRNFTKKIPHLNFIYLGKVMPKKSSKGHRLVSTPSEIFGVNTAISYAEYSHIKTAYKFGPWLLLF